MGDLTQLRSRFRPSLVLQDGASGESLCPNDVLHRVVERDINLETACRCALFRYFAGSGNLSPNLEI